MHSNQLRVFISSTFSDLQPERELLIKKVFPKIRAKCRERGVEFIEVDLRWGITAEEASSGKVIRICLEEIERSPYFIGILGSRYGWIPTVSDVEKDAGLIEKYPWMSDRIQGRKSIIDIELSHAILNSDCVGIYDQSSARIADTDRQPLEALKQTLQNAGLRYRKFVSTEDLGNQVYEDFVAILDRDCPTKALLSDLEKIRREHDAFALDRTQSYIASPDYEQKFDAWVASNESPLIISGRSGLGKSSLMAHLTQRYATLHPSAFVIRHFVGASAGASKAEDVLRHCMTEIKDRYAITEPIPTDPVQMREQFSDWLARVRSDETLVLAIDAVNQLTGVDNEMHWLPNFIPKNVRLLISTTPGTSFDQLCKRTHVELQIRPLDRHARTQVASEFLRRYHKTITDHQLQLLVDSPQFESPLFLRTVLEELRVFGVHEQVDEQLAKFTACTSEEGLFQEVLSRMEEDHGRVTVEKVMTMIYASRFGLLENELLGVTGLSQLALSGFLITLEFHLTNRGGLYNFFHNFLREAVRLRYLSTANREQIIHAELAAYFSSQDQSLRKRDEEPWQWQKAENWDAFSTCLTNIEMLESLLATDQRFELIRYWTALREHVNLPEVYHRVVELFEATSNDPQRCAEVASRLGSALIASSFFTEAEYQLRHALEIWEGLLGCDNLETATTLTDLGELMDKTARFDEAVGFHRRALSIRQSQLTEYDPIVLKSLNDFGTSLYSRGQYNEAKKYFLIAKAGFEKLYGLNHAEVASVMNNLGTIAFRTGQYEEAKNSFEGGLEIGSRVYGENHFENLAVLNNLAMAYSLLDNFEAASRLYERAIGLKTDIYGLNSPTTARSYLNLAMMLARTGKLEEATETQQTAIEIWERVMGIDHDETINAHLNMGLICIRKGDVGRGESIFSEWMPKEEIVLGASHPQVVLHRQQFEEEKRRYKSITNQP